MRGALSLFAAAAAAVLLTTGAAGAAEAATVLKVTTSSGLTYNAKVLKAKAGKVTSRYANSSGIDHNVRIRLGTKQIGGTKTLTKGTTSVTLTLRKGTYSFYCSVDSHEKAGMKGTLKVS